MPLDTLFSAKTKITIKCTENTIIHEYRQEIAL